MDWSKNMNNFSRHLPFAELTELAEGRLRRSLEVSEHLASCSQCRVEFESVRKTIELMRSDTSESAPASLLAQIKSYPGRALSPEPSLLRRVIASLSFDSFTNAPAFGFRSQSARGRQLIYSAETADIEVRVSPADAEWQIAGQVLGADCVSGDVELESESFSASATINELCEFSFGAVPAGAYTLSIRLPELLIETPRLELGP